jgi:hypothetical protein
LGIYTLALEFPRARLKYRFYGIVSLFQSFAFFGCTALLARTPDKPEAVINAFIISYSVAATIAFSINGWPRLTRLNLKYLTPTFFSGCSYTLSTALENILYLGMRFIVMLTGSTSQLGVFSFSVDLAQRVIGVFANIISFTAVPLAFNKNRTNERLFNNMLLKAGLVALLVCSSSLAAVLAAQSSGFVPALSGPLFDSATFIIISVAIIINRIKKIIIDPQALRENRASLLPLGFAIASPIALFLAIAFQKYGPLVPPSAYLLGYIGATAITIIAIQKNKSLNQQ